MDLGVKTTTNADDPALFNIDWNSEYALARSSLGLSETDIATCITNARQASFIPQDSINRIWPLN